MDGIELQIKIAANAQSMRRWLSKAEESLANHSDRLNAINIFPVADSDTGTNLYQTVRSAAEAAAVVESADVGEVLAIAAQAAMEDARGNSGTLFSVMLAAVAEPLEGFTRLTGPLLAAALQRAQIRSWTALSDPVPGTMLSVLEATARAADAAQNGDDSNSGLVLTLEAAVAAARDAVVVTESQIDALADANVVDAGGVGFLLILDALRATVKGEEPDPALVDGLSGLSPQQRPVVPTDPENDGVELMCTINLSPLDAAGLRMRLDELGDSVIMSAVTDVPDGYRWRVHVHVPDAIPALAAIRELGDPANIRVTALSAHPVTAHALPGHALPGHPLPGAGFTGADMPLIDREFHESR